MHVGGTNWLVAGCFKKKNNNRLAILIVVGAELTTVPPQTIISFIPAPESRVDCVFSCRLWLALWRFSPGHQILAGTSMADKSSHLSRPVSPSPAAPAKPSDLSSNKRAT